MEWIKRLLLSRVPILGILNVLRGSEAHNENLIQTECQLGAVESAFVIVLTEAQMRLRVSNNSEAYQMLFPNYSDLAICQIILLQKAN